MKIRLSLLLAAMLALSPMCAALADEAEDAAREIAATGSVSEPADMPAPDPAPVKETAPAADPAPAKESAQAIEPIPEPAPARAGGPVSEQTIEPADDSVAAPETQVFETEITEAAAADEASVPADENAIEANTAEPDLIAEPAEATIEPIDNEPETVPSAPTEPDGESKPEPKAVGSAYSTVTFTVENDDRTYTYTLSGIDENIAGSLPNDYVPGVGMTDDTIIDAEKIMVYGLDSMLCWAASVSNSFIAGGWASQAINPATGEAFTSEDEVMDYFRKRFNDEGGMPSIAAVWLFNGIAESESERFDDFSKLRDGPEAADGVLKQICADSVVRVHDLEIAPESIDSALDAVRGGAPVCVSIGFYLPNSEGTNVRYGGHALTLCGYCTDESGNIVSVIVADSDNSADEDQPNYDTDSQPNILREYPVVRNDDGLWQIEDYTEPFFNVIVETMVSITPYTPEFAQQVTENEGTADAQNTIDLILWNAYTTASLVSPESRRAFREGDSIALCMEVTNRSYEDCKDLIPARVTITERDTGAPVTEFYVYCNDDGSVTSLSATYQMIDLSSMADLKVGDYRISVTLNPADFAERLDEAYFLNNHESSWFFSVLRRYQPPKKPEQKPEKTNRQNNKPARITVRVIADFNGLCTLDNIAENGVYNITAYASEHALNAFEREIIADNSSVWEPVPPAAYSVTTAEEGDHFRLALTREYMESLGSGEQTFRVTLNGMRYKVKVIVS